jgi:hypothetical protein
MTGIAEYNFPAFREAERELSSKGYQVLNPITIQENQNQGGPIRAWEWYVRQSLRMVLDAEAIALLPGWFASRGAMLEVNVAHALNMTVHSLSHWLKEEKYESSTA